MQCCEMLDYLGVSYVQSAGEAEAMCAFLNKNHVSNKHYDTSSSYWVLPKFCFQCCYICDVAVLL